MTRPFRFSSVLAILVLLATGAPLHAEVDLTNGLEGLWQFEEPATATAARNTASAASLLDGTFIGNATTTGGKFGRAVALADGGYVDISGLVAPTGGDAYTWSAWFQSDAEDAQQHYILETSGTWALSGRIELSSDQYHAFAQTSNDTGGVTGVSLPAGFNDDWHHMVVTYEENQSLKMYVDGVLAGEDTVSGGLLSTNGFHIGADRAGARTWIGRLDDVGVWNRVLGTDEIAHLWNGGLGNAIPQGVCLEQGLAAHWDFNETGGATADNAVSASPALDGMLRGGATFTAEGKLGGAVSLGGTGAYIDVANEVLADGVDAYTATAWFKVSDLDARRQTILESSENGSISVELTADNHLGYGVQTTGESVIHDTRIVPELDTWHQVAVVYDALADQTKFYYDGQEHVAGRGDPSGALRDTNGLHLGTYRGADDRWFQGALDDVAVWGRPLNDAEIAWLWNGGQGREVVAAPEQQQTVFLQNGGTAHRGFSGEHPENTLESFQAAIDLGADWLELDIFKTADGKLVVIHDSTTGRTGDLNLDVASSTYEELQQVDVATYFRVQRGLTLEECPPARIPLLEEVLALVMEQNDSRVSIQPKQDIVDDAVALIHTMEATAWAGFNEGSLSRCIRVKQLDPTLPVFYDVSSLGSSTISTALQYGFESVVVHYSGVTQSVVDQLHAAGLEAGAWTVNNPATMKQLVDLGIDRLYTDYPDVALRWFFARKHGEPLLGHYGTANPTGEGWTATGDPTNVGTGVSGDGLAWRIDDNNVITGSRCYEQSLAGDALNTALAEGWSFAADVKILDGETSLSGAIQLGVALPGSKSFILSLGSEADGDPLVRLLDGEGTGETFALDGYGGGYHVYEMLYNPVTETVDVLVDDLLLISDQPGMDNPGNLNRIYWGSDSDGGLGDAAYRVVEFVLGYDFTLEGDLDGDGFVGGDDLDIVRAHWGETVTPGDLSSGDASGDGFVGGDDLDWIRAHWGQGAPPATAVPEPGVAILLVGGLAGLTGLRGFGVRRS